jgi:hypothetical protein
MRPEVHLLFDMVSFLSETLVFLQIRTIVIPRIFAIIVPRNRRQNTLSPKKTAKRHRRSSTARRGVESNLCSGRLQAWVVVIPAL